MPDRTLNVRVQTSSDNLGVSLARRSIESTSARPQRLDRVGLGAAAAFGGMVAIGDFGRIVTAYQNLNNRIRTVIANEREAADPRARLTLLARETRAGVEGTIESYTRLAQAPAELLRHPRRICRGLIEASGGTEVGSAR